MKQSKIKFLIFSTLYIIHCTLYITQAQPVKKDFTFYRGDLVKLTFQINGNVTTSDLLFAVKLTKSFSAPRLIQKTNATASQISAIYAAPFTKIEVYLLPEDTRDLTSKVYYYDLIKTDPADSTKETTLFTGELKNDADVVTPFDGTNLAADGTRITTVSIDNGTVQDEMLYWDATTHRWQPAGTTLSQAQRDSIQNYIADSLSIVNASIATKLNTTQLTDTLNANVRGYQTLPQVKTVVSDSLNPVRTSIATKLNTTQLTDTLNANVRGYQTLPQVKTVVSDSLNPVRTSIATKLNTTQLTDTLNANVRGYQTLPQVKTVVSDSLNPIKISIATKLNTTQLTDTLNANVRGYQTLPQVKTVVSDSLNPVRTSIATKLNTTQLTDTLNANVRGYQTLPQVKTVVSDSLVSINSIVVKETDTLNFYLGGTRMFRVAKGNVASSISSFIGGYTGNSIDNGYGDVIAGGGSAAYENVISGNSFGRTISGGYDNYIGANVVSTISGGGHNAILGLTTHGVIGGGSLDTISAGDYGTISGGTQNKVSANNAVVSGGANNIVNAIGSTVSGGAYNVSTGTYNIISGGYSNYNGGSAATIVGGQQNYITNISANGNFSVIGGGLNDSIGTTSLSSYSTIAGGRLNKMNGQYGTISGGYANTILGVYSTIGGGTTNMVNGTYGFIGGGLNNKAGGEGSVISGGILHYIDNTTTRGNYAAIVGGYADSIGTTASSRYSTIAGGRGNVINGEYSFAFGYRIKSTGNGITSFADGTASDFTITTANTFNGRFSGGYNFTGGDATFAGNVKSKVFTAALTDGAPTATEISTATSKTPSTTGAGWTTLIKDSDGSGLVYRIISDGTSWYYFITTKAL